MQVHKRSSLRPYRNRSVGLLAVLCLVLLLSLAACGDNTATAVPVGVATTSSADNATTPPVKVAVGFTAPDFNATTLSGDALQLSHLRGKAVILNFWATYCPSCRQEFPDFIQAYNTNKNQLAIIGINWREDESAVKSFVKDFKIEFPVLLDKNGVLINQYHAPAHPYSVFINAAGVITAIIPGQASPQMLSAALAKTLNATAVVPTTSTTTVTSQMELMAPPGWFNEIPLYENGQHEELSGSTVASLGYNPSQYYATSIYTPDSVTTITDYYTTKLVAAGWQKTEQTQLTANPQAGQLIYFTRTQGSENQVLAIVPFSRELFNAYPRTKDLAASMPGNTNVVFYVAFNK
jgi:peroxiredoxin